MTFILLHQQGHLQTMPRVPTLVNADHVTSITPIQYDDGTGCYLHFTGDQSMYVFESFDEIKALLIRKETE